MKERNNQWEREELEEFMIVSNNDIYLFRFLHLHIYRALFLNTSSRVPVLLLRTVGNWKALSWCGLQWLNIDIKIRENMFLGSAVGWGSYTPTEIQHVSNPTTLRKEPSRPHAVQEDLTSSSREQFARCFALITESKLCSTRNTLP
jgi:hypothetical protein